MARPPFTSPSPRFVRVTALGAWLVLALVLGLGCEYSDHGGGGGCVAGRACVLGANGPCAQGVTRCPDGRDGEVECVPAVSPSPEVCDGVDNDCDGNTDEGIPNQSSGSDVGLCQPQILSCQMGGFVEIQERIDPQPEVCGDGLDQDCNGSDCPGPPQVQLTSPAPGSRLVEGSRIQIAAQASDADGIDRVEFRVDGVLVGTDTRAPYSIDYSVPVGVSRIDIEARAFDRTGLDSSTGVLRFPVDDAPGPIFEDDYGSDLGLGDDEAVAVDFSRGFRFPFYGTSYARVFVGSNGRLTFSFGSSQSEETLFAFNFQPGIAPLFDDLAPEGGSGGVFARQEPDRLVVTWDRVELSNGRDATFQVVLFDDGEIQIGYFAKDAREGLVGITPGFSPDPGESDFSTDTPLTGASNTMLYEIFEDAGGGERFDLKDRFLVFRPTGSNAYEASLVPFD